MKQKVIMIGIAGAVLFFGCKKDNSLQPGYSNTQANSTILAPDGSNVNSGKAIVNYKIVTTPPVNTELLIWNSGYLMTGNIFFDGNVLLGNSMAKEHYSLSVAKQVPVLPVLASGSFVGSLDMLYGIYYGPVFGIVLAGSYPPGVNRNPSPALLLTGNYMKGGINFSVQVSISQPTAITAQGNNPTNMLGSQTNYDATLIFNLKQLTVGINASSLDNAIITNDSIIISESSNQGLYQVILNNLANCLQVQFTPSKPNVSDLTPNIAPALKS